MQDYNATTAVPVPMTQRSFTYSAEGVSKSNDCNFFGGRGLNVFQKVIT